MVVLFVICIRSLIKEFHLMRSEVWWEYLRDLPRSAIVWSLFSASSPIYSSRPTKWWR